MVVSAKLLYMYMCVGGLLIVRYLHARMNYCVLSLLSRARACALFFLFFSCFLLLLNAHLTASQLKWTSKKKKHRERHTVNWIEMYLTCTKTWFVYCTVRAGLCWWNAVGFFFTFFDVFFLVCFFFLAVIIYGWWKFKYLWMQANFLHGSLIGLPKKKWQRSLEICVQFNRKRAFKMDFYRNSTDFNLHKVLGHNKYSTITKQQKFNINIKMNW